MDENFSIIPIYEWKNLQLDEKREKRKENSQSSFLNFQAISEPCEATVLRGSVEKEREMCGSDGTPTTTVTATPAELLRVVAMASLAGP